AGEPQEQPATLRGLRHVVRLSAVLADRGAARQERLPLSLPQRRRLAVAGRPLRGRAAGTGTGRLALSADALVGKLAGRRLGRGGGVLLAGLWPRLAAAGLVQPAGGDRARPCGPGDGGRSG